MCSYRTPRTLTQMELLPLRYKFLVSYGGASKEKYQDVSGDPVVVFQTTLVTMKLLDSTGSTELTGGAHYYASGWKTFGVARRPRKWSCCRSDTSSRSPTSVPM
jgi:hypothetical protein